MAAEGGQPAPKSEAPAEKKDQAAQADQKKASKDQPKAGAAEAGEKKLSGAELKKKAKEEKAARRAAAKTTQPQPPAGAPAQSDAKSGSKSKPWQEAGQAAAQHGKIPAPRSAAPVPAAPKEVKPSIPDYFSHLAMAKGVNITHADKDVHPAVLVLGQQMSTMAISDSTTRLEATLLAFKKVTNSALF